MLKSVISCNFDGFSIAILRIVRVNVTFGSFAANRPVNNKNKRYI